MSAEQQGGPRDWDKELAKIDKLMAAGPAPAGVPAQGTGDRGQGTGRASMASSPVPRPPSPAVGTYARLFTWVRLFLGLALGIGMTQWPYTHGCDLPLLAYLGGVATVIVAAFWSMVSSWRTRSGLAHFLSIGLVFWGAALAAREVLPRIGYAKQTATWRCPAHPVQVAPAQNPAPAPTTPRIP